MNFVLADFTRDEGPAVTFAGHRLPVPESVVEAKQGLDGYFGRKVILGIRPSDFEDASLGDASWARLPVTVGVTEELGTEIHVIFTIDAPPVEHASITSAADGADEEDETVAALAGGKSLWTARVSARSSGPRRAAAPARRRHQPPALLRPHHRRIHRPPAGRGRPSGSGDRLVAREGSRDRERGGAAMLGPAEAGRLPGARPGHQAGHGDREGHHGGRPDRVRRVLQRAGAAGRRRNDQHDAARPVHRHGRGGDHRGLGAFREPGAGQPRHLRGLRVRHERHRHGAVGHPRQGPRPPAVPAARRVAAAGPRLRGRLRPRLRRSRFAGRGGAAAGRARLPGGEAAAG